MESNLQMVKLPCVGNWILQPVAMVLENVDMFPIHVHAPTVFRFCIWAGYRVVWPTVTGMADMSPHHRS